MAAAWLFLILLVGRTAALDAGVGVGTLWETSAWVAEEQASPTALDDKHRTTSYISPPIRLDPGRVVLTPPKQTPLQMPSQPFVLTSVRWEVVRHPTGEPVPLTEVYNHHVVLYGGGGRLAADVCGGAHLDMIDGFLGIGAEARGTMTELPEGFAFPGQGPWLANIHLIRSEGVPDVKSCIECACHRHGGSEDCCPHLSVCPGFPDGPSTRNASDVKDYALKYVVGWSPAAEKYTMAQYKTFDATGCQLEFHVPARCPWMWRHDNLQGGRLPGAVGLRGSGRDLPSDFEVAVRPPSPRCVERLSWDYDLPDGAEGEVLFSKGHIHAGGLNISAYVLRRGGGAPELLCCSSARYGGSDAPAAHAQPPAGDERGYVVGMSTCLFANNTRRPRLRKGDKIRVEVAYRTDLWFNGVMGLMDLALASTPPDEFV